MISAERVYEVFGITPGPWKHSYYDGWDCVIPQHTTIKICNLVENNPANADVISSSPEMLVSAVHMLEQIEWASDVRGGIGYMTECYNEMFKTIESADSQNRPWKELLKELKDGK